MFFFLLLPKWRCLLCHSHQFLSIQDIKCVQRTFSCVKGTKCCHTNRNAISSLLKTQNAEFKHTQSLSSLYSSWSASDSCFSICAPFDTWFTQTSNSWEGKGEEGAFPTAPTSLSLLGGTRWHRMEETISCLNLGKKDNFIHLLLLSLTSTITAFSVETQSTPNAYAKIKQR